MKVRIESQVTRTALNPGDQAGATGTVAQLGEAALVEALDAVVEDGVDARQYNNEASANDVLSFVASIFARGDVRD